MTADLFYEGFFRVLVFVILGCLATAVFFALAMALTVYFLTLGLFLKVSAQWSLS